MYLCHYVVHIIFDVLYGILRSKNNYSVRVLHFIIKFGKTCIILVGLIILDIINHNIDTTETLLFNKQVILKWS